MPSYKKLTCNSATKQWVHSDGSQTNNVECVAPRDTPCGLVEDTFTKGVGVSYTCGDFNSIYQTSAVQCNIDCADDNDLVVGGATLSCSGGNWASRASNDLTCAATVCGDPEDHFTIDASSGATFTCNGSSCSVVCSDAAKPTSNVASVTCNAGTKSFNTVTLFGNTDYPVVNPDIECARIP